MLVELAKSCDIDVRSLTRDQLIEALRKFVLFLTAKETIVLGAETKFDPDEDLLPLITAEVIAEQDKARSSQISATLKSPISQIRLTTELKVHRLVDAFGD